MILNVHGAWYQPIHYRPLIDGLRVERHTVLALSLLASGYDDSVDCKSHLDDLKCLGEALSPESTSGAALWSTPTAAATSPPRN